MLGSVLGTLLGSLLDQFWVTLGSVLGSLLGDFGVSFYCIKQYCSLEFYLKENLKEGFWNIILINSEI